MWRLCNLLIWKSIKNKNVAFSLHYILIKYSCFIKGMVMIWACKKCTWSTILKLCHWATNYNLKQIFITDKFLVEVWTQDRLKFTSIKNAMSWLLCHTDILTEDIKETITKINQVMSFVVFIFVFYKLDCQFAPAVCISSWCRRNHLTSLSEIAIEQHISNLTS